MLICWQEDGGGTIEIKVVSIIQVMNLNQKDTLKEEYGF